MNQLLSKTPDASGTTNYGYDNRNRLTSKATPEGTLAYTYDSAGDVKTIQSSNAGGANLAYAYDSLNRLSTVTDPVGATAYTYDNVGNLQTVAYPNSVAHSYSYDSRNRLTSLGVAGTGGQLAGYSYILDASGHRLGVTELSGRTVSYGYDNLYRLTSETTAADPHGVNGAVSYTYDAVGNRTQKVSTIPGYPGGLSNYNANDELSTDAYDANGNTTQSVGLGYAYDFENHLVQQAGLTIVYDGDGNRVSKTGGSGTTQYLVDTQNPTGYAQVVEELQNATVTRTYTRGLELISEHQAVNSTPTTSYYVFDGHGSVRALTGPTGAITDTYDYDAFGNLLHSTGTTPNNYLFAGEQFDPDLNLYYNRARYLNISTGRFWSMDPKRELPRNPNTLHRYRYASGDPVNRIDRLGLDDIAELGAAESIGETLDVTSVPANGVQLVENIGEEASALAQTETETVADAELQAAEESAGAQAQEGEFVEETISNPRAAQYQARITGQPGQAYELNGVRFDGASDAGELLEAKGPGYANLLRQKFAGSVIDKLLAQAARQVAAAAGRETVWHFAEQEAPDAVIEELIKLGIKVVVTP